MTSSAKRVTQLWSGSQPQKPDAKARSAYVVLAMASLAVAIVFFPTASRAAGRQAGVALSDRTKVLARAERMMAEHQPTAAVDVLRSFLEQHPDDPDVLLGLGRALLWDGKRDEAGAAFRKALAIEPESTVANDAVGQMLLEQKQYPEAMDRFETSLSSALRDPAARTGELQAATQLALSVRKQGYPDLALEVLRHACSKLPDDPQLSLDRGVQATELGLWSEAKQALQAAHSLDTQNPMTLYALARLALDQQHLPEAEEDLKRYLSEQPNDASAHFGLGHLYAMEQRSLEARAEFETSLKLQPRQTESYYQLGDLDLKAHQNEAAESQFRKVLQDDPNHAGALTGMGELALRSKHYALAEQFLAHAEQADPSYPVPHYYRGLALARLGRSEEADKELRLGDGRPRASSDGTGSPATAATERATTPSASPQ